jgi:hypothetical protein
MKAFELLLTEANIAAKIKDPKIIKQIAIAMRHDGTLPKAAIARLGPRPNDQDTLQLWSNILDKALSSTNYGDISADSKFDDWLTRLYINGQADYEDIDGEGGDALGAWKALSIRGKLRQEHQDFNKFHSLKQIQRIINDRQYRDELRRMKDAAVIEKHKREKKEVTVYEDKRFLVVVPYNYGSCYTFNNSHGFQAGFCTGSSSGMDREHGGSGWFRRYASEGPIISVFDKENPDDVNGKWQLHAPTNQCNNGDQTIRSEKKFAELFPGLLSKIIAGIQAHGEELKKDSTNLVSGGYDIASAINDIKQSFPLSAASQEPEPEQADENGPGTYLVTHTATGRTARITGDSLDHVKQQLTTRHPTANLDDFTFEKQAEENGDQ